MGVMYEVNQSTGAIGDPVLDSSTGSGGGGLTQEEHDALMSIASMPARGDINPERSISSQGVTIAANSTGYIPILGYDKIAVGRGTNTPSSIYFADVSGNNIGTISVPSSSNTFGEYVSIPSNAIYVAAVSASLNIWFECSLLTADSPYNPDNQNP